MDYSQNWLKQNPENFPVAGRILPEETRAPILAFYRFARGADQIADGRENDAKKRERLLAIDQALATRDYYALPPFARDFADLLSDLPQLLPLARDLLAAFMQDTAKSRYHDYTELLDYCRLSAAPVGRAVLIICGETKAHLEASDALCSLLQILNHIQDCSEDYVRMGRVYLPLDWFTMAGAKVEHLAKSESNKPLRKVLHRGLDNCKTLLKKAAELPPTIENRRVRLQVAFIYQIALALTLKLRYDDPLAHEVRLGKPALALCFIKAVPSAW